MDPEEEKKRHRFQSGVFLTSVAGASILFGFGMTLAMAKRKDPNMFTKGMMPSKEVPESGSSLAMRALGWGTFYSVSGFSLFCFTVWKLMGVSNLTEFREKMQSIMPAVPKSSTPGRSDFKSFRELMQYISDESDKSKNK
ncbi:hypothetical protein CHUAL_002577 [Chamberlinius hualienensis]